MARKTNTNLNNLDDALRVLNGARIAFRPEHLPVIVEEDGIFCDWMGPCCDLPLEMENAIGLAIEAAAKVSSALEADGSLRITVDYRDRWVLIPNVT